MNILPKFDESSPDLPADCGIEQSHDGNWYPYHVDEDDTQIAHLKDEQGLDLCCTTRKEALAALKEHAPIDMTNIEDPAVQARLLALHERQLQAEQQTAAFYDLMAES